MSTRRLENLNGTTNGHAASSAGAFSFNAEALAPLIRSIAAEVVAQLDSARAGLDGKLAYSEEEAARLLSLEPHQLRDERLRGRIGASQIVGSRIRYSREDLTRYLAERRWQPKE